MARSETKDTDFRHVQWRHARQCAREARVAALIWFLGFLVCGTTMATMGYVPAPERPGVPALIWGVPAWVVWGLFLPWIVLVGVTWWFAVWFLKEDEPYVEFPEEGDRDGAA